MGLLLRISSEGLGLFGTSANEEMGLSARVLLHVWISERAVLHNRVVFMECCGGHRSS